MEPSSEPRSRGKPRDENLRDTILTASAELLLEKGFKHFTIEGVAARSKASKVTIYKWWPSKGALALDGYFHTMTDAIAFPETSSARDDVEHQLSAVITRFTKTAYGRAMMELIAAAQEDADLKRELNRRYIEPRRKIAGRAFARLLGWDPVEDQDALYAVTDQVYGAIYNRLLFGLIPLDETFARQLVEFWVPRPPQT